MSISNFLNYEAKSIILLICRIFVGGFFFFSGFDKLFTEAGWQRMYETISGAGIPLPYINTLLASLTEMLAGLFISIGFMFELSSLALIFVMSVAIFTTKLAVYKIVPFKLESFKDFLFTTIYSVEPLYIIIFITFILAGSGRYSLDKLLSDKF
jgi:putative oxidoreductase